MRDHQNYPGAYGALAGAIILANIDVSLACSLEQARKIVADLRSKLAAIDECHPPINDDDVGCPGCGARDASEPCSCEDTPDPALDEGDTLTNLGLATNDGGLVP